MDNNMNKKLAIKGHATRGKEVIEILEMLGGKNIHNSWGVFENRIYTIDEKTDEIIDVSERHYSVYNLFTLEEFFEKFPYKVRDKVIAYYKGILAQFTIQDMRWNYELNKVEYKICSSWLDTSVIIDKANKSVFDANAQCCDIMNNIIKKDMEEIKIGIPKGYEFVGVDDDAQQVVLQKIQPEYPKTYEECCKALNLTKYPPALVPNKSMFISQYEDFPHYYEIQKFAELLICRDAYWKIAGEQMGLDKPWKQDYCDRCFIIANNKGNIYTYEYHGDNNVVLAFPIKEMRDAFKENFKELIEECKELL